LFEHGHEGTGLGKTRLNHPPFLCSAIPNRRLGLFHLMDWMATHASARVGAPDRVGTFDSPCLEAWPFQIRRRRSLFPDLKFPVLNLASCARKPKNTAQMHLW